MASLIQEEVGEIIANRLMDPAIGPVTVTRVKVSKDIKYADVYISGLEDEKKTEASLSALERSRGYIQKVLAARVIIRKIPILRFHYDKNYGAALRVYELLEEI